MAITDNLISFWELGEASGTRADSKGTNTLSDGNTVGSDTGKVGTAAAFVAGSNEYLYHASNTDLQMGDIDFTIQAWIYLADTTLGMIVTKDTDSPASSRDYTLCLTTGIGAFWYINGGGASLNVASNVNLNATTWYHVIAQHDAANDLLILGIDAQASPASVNTGGVAPQVSAAEFRIGARQYSGAEGYFNGRIDQVGIWKRLLTAEEITWLYNSGNGRSYAEMAPATGQFARPASDVADGNWLNASSNNTDLFESINEETAGGAGDSDYIRSGANPVQDTVEVGLSSVGTPDAGGTITVRVRARVV